MTEEEMIMELNHERDMADAGRARYLASNSKARGVGRASYTQGARSVISMMIQPLADLIVDEIARLEDGKVRRKPPEIRTLKLLKPTATAAIALTVMTDLTASSGAKDATHAKLGFGIGDAIAREYAATQLRKADPGMFKAIVLRCNARAHGAVNRSTDILEKYRKMVGPEADPMGTQEKVRLGVFLLAAMETLGIVTSRVETRKRRAQKLYEISDQFFQQITSMDNLLADLSPNLSPMIAPPLDWEDTRVGGYYSLTSNRMVVARHATNGIKNADRTEMPRVFDSLNYLQKVPYKINKRVLDVVQRMREAGISCESLPPMELEPLPTKPHDIATNEEARNAYKLAAREAHLRNNALKGKILAVTKTIEVAERHKDFEKIYFPKHLDFRGRCYDKPKFLKPQGDDLSKGLLLFGTGKPLGTEGGYWLAVHGANTHGEDKISLDERVEWVLTNEPRILAAAAEPFAERFWMEADKPFQFLAFCFEWAGARECGDDYVSHLPVALDGSCNGLQHLSALLKDPIGGSAVNLTPADKPQDLYSRVLGATVAELKVRAQRGEPTAQAWLPLMKRKTVKRNVMTLPYGATRQGFADQIMEDTLRPLQRDKLCPFNEPYNAARYLGEIVWNATGQVVVAAQKAMAWLQECARIVSVEGSGIHWTTPSGFLLVQDYRKPNLTSVELNAVGNRLRVTIADGTTPKIHSRKMSFSIAPNFIHALDAAHMMRTVEHLIDIDPSMHFSMVHDSYATHACDTERLSYGIREAFVQMYSEKNWLEDFKASLEGQLGIELPPVPESGDLVLEEVLDSQYFFA